MKNNMKKLLTFLLAVLSTVSLVACGGVSREGGPAEIEVVDSAVLGGKKDGALGALSTANGTLSDLKINGVAISSYTVVYENQTYAQTLADTLIANIKTATGYTLSKQVSTATQKTNEILVGNTGRSIATSFYNEGIAKNYKKTGWIVSGGKLALLGSNDVTLTDTCNLFAETYLSATTQVKDITSANTLQTTLRYRDMGLPERTSTGDVRIFAHNILAGAQTVEQFNQGVLAFRLMEADIYCFQEYGNTWKTQNLTSAMSSMGCTLVSPNTGGKANMTPIYYNSTRLTLQESGWSYLDGGVWNEENVVNAQGNPLDHNTSKSYTYAKFLDKTTNKDFIVFSVHFTHSSGGVRADGASYMDICHKMDVQHVVRVSNELRGRFGADIPIVVIGDFNMGPNRAPMNQFILGGFDNARSNSKKTHNMDLPTASESEYGPPRYQYPWYVIDQCVFSGSLAANYYEVVISPYTWRYTDHQAHMFEFTPN